MFRTMVLSGYDMFSAVQWSLTVTEYDDAGAETRKELLRLAGDFQSSGEDNTRKWVRDLLHDAIETL